MATIIIIDDEEGLRKMLRHSLENLGHVIHEAPDGRRGVELVKSHSPDLIITDILMPEQEGLETIRLVRRSAPDIPIIAISGGGRTARMDFLEVAQEFGANATVSKPFRPREFVQLVERLLGDRPQSDATTGASV